MKYLIPLSSALLMMNSVNAKPQDTIRVATFNVSMEALNYKSKEDKSPITGKELAAALLQNHQQIKNIAEIIQRVNPDILLLNELDNLDNNDSQTLRTFIKQYLSISQNGQKGIDFPYYYQGPVNTGVLMPVDVDGNGEIKHPADTYGFGHFPGHFSMALISKFPINVDTIRTFQQFKWRDMPNALKPTIPESGEDYYPSQVWEKMRLSSKSHWDIPVTIGKKSIHILASHPTPPVFDGPEDRNGKRNHDEIRFWQDYISTDNHYIYDDNKNTGGLKANASFVILGDLNASTDDGDANVNGIGGLLAHPRVADPKPESEAAKLHSPDNQNAKNHTAYWRMRADYVLPSSDLQIIGSGVFWPKTMDEQYRLIDGREASSDHRLVWVDIKLK